MILRGGLGNQLYQISALSYFSRKYGFFPVIYDFDLRINPRYGKSANYRSLNLERWFTQEVASSPLRGFSELCFRLLLRLNRKLNFVKIFKEADLLSGEMRIPRFFFVCDSFQNKNYPLALPNDAFQDIFARVRNIQESRNDGRVAVHVRLTDFLPSNPFDSQYYRFAYQNMIKREISQFDVFSDDIPLAKRLLHQVGYKNLSFPENSNLLSPEQLLSLLSTYSYFIASKSSLSWWACFLATRDRADVIVIHPWDPIEDFFIEVTPI